MKNNIIGWSVLALLFIFPFRYAADSQPGIVWLFSMIACVLGYAALLFIFISKPFESKIIVEPKLKTVKRASIQKINPLVTTDNLTTLTI